MPFVQGSAFPKQGGRIHIDRYLSVQPGIYAIGDCAASDPPLPCTAQAAAQQAKYLARVLNAPHDTAPPFQYKHRGMLAYIGGWNALADLSGGFKWKGTAAWVFWRSAYWTNNVSIRNKILIPMYWFKSWLFGRDISRF